MTEGKPSKKVGRPTDYRPELADRICEGLSEGKSLRTVCMADDMPSRSSVFAWLRKYPEFLAQYARAKEEAADALADEVMDISDDGTNDWMELTNSSGETYYKPDKEVVARSKLRIETRKWLMAKMKPKRYGDKLDLTSDGKPLPTPIFGGVANENKDK